MSTAQAKSRTSASTRLSGPRLRASIAALIAVTGLSGCSAVGVLNALEPKGGTTITHDVAFTSGDRGKLDVYRPAGAAGAATLVVFIYGGGWDTGAKADYGFVGNALASRGYVTVIPDYRIYPQVRWPAFLEDNAKAVAWAKAHAAEFGADPNKLFLAGHSAGAYDAMMLSLDKRWLAAVGIDPDRDVKGVVGLAGPYDFLPLKSDELKTIFGPPEGRPATQPIAYATASAPPIYIATDLGDKVVDPGNTTRLANKVRNVGGRVEERYYTRLNHALMVGVIAAPLRFLAPVLRDLSAFIDKTAAEPRAMPRTGGGS
ncbi:alpha/beta hydrolase [soil metagenome]